MGVGELGRLGGWGVRVRVREVGERGSWKNLLEFVFLSFWFLGVL